MLQPIPPCEKCGSRWVITRADKRHRCRRCGHLSQPPEPVSARLSFVAYSLRDEK
jgi:PHP family Zn ribbon phosphoesterase